MATLHRETVTSVHHWTDRLFSFTTSRDTGFRFENGHFTMIGLEQPQGRLMRAYSIVSANYEEELEFFSIKVPHGPLTSQLQNIQVGDEVLVGGKPIGSLTQDHLLSGRNLYLLSTGTGLAPFLSIIKDPEVYEQYDRVILTHGCRFVSDFAYGEFITEKLPQNAFFGEQVKQKLLYYPTVTRESFHNQGRLTDLMASGRLFSDLGLDRPNLEHDRFMICGSPGMIKDTCKLLDSWGFKESRHGKQGHYVIERAFAER